MSRLVQVLLALSLLLNAVFLAGFIFRSSIAPLPFEARMPPPPPPQRPSVLEVVANDVSLDAGQRQALRGVFEHDHAEAGQEQGSAERSHRAEAQTAGQRLLTTSPRRA